MKKNFVSAILSVLLLATLLHAGEKITVVTEDWPPYNYEENGKLSGFSTEVVEAVLKGAGLEYGMRIYPWARAYKMAQHDPNVLIYTISRTPERENAFHWIGPIAPRTIYLFKMKARQDVNVTSLNDAKKYDIGLVRNDATHKFFAGHGFDPEHLVLTNGEDQNIKMLSVDRVDLITGNELALSHLVKAVGLDYALIERSLRIIDEGGYYMAFSKATPEEVVAKARQTFERLEAEGTIDTIREKYMH